MTPFPTIGVEEELALVDPATGLLCGRSDRVIDALPPDVRPYVDHEMKRCQIETMSAVHDDLGALAADLRHLRSSVSAAAAAVGCGLQATGTHPRSSWRDHPVTPKDAYRDLAEDYRRLADEQLLFGCHVHVAVDDPDLRIDVLDRVRPWLPVLLALSANSPFWEGDDTGYASYRYLVFSRWPTFGTPDSLGSWAGYQGVVDRLISSGAIDSPKRLYWTVRPSSRYPTIEFRIADVCPTVEEAAMVAGLARALVVTAMREVEAGAPASNPRVEVLRMAEWQAARYGLSGPLVDAETGAQRTAREAVSQLLDHVGDALDATGDGRLVRRTVSEVLAGGNGADRQRLARGPGSPPAGLSSPLADRPRSSSAA
ncbi:MAG: carboxylate-amine ligase [Aquihabitans sp.]